jgi:hypothetical protein
MSKWSKILDRVYEARKRRYSNVLAEAKTKIPVETKITEPGLARFEGGFFYCGNLRRQVYVPNDSRMRFEDGYAHHYGFYILIDCECGSKHEVPLEK